jgi:CubicO group peptidase (beta-lactamase class C family)
MMIDPLHAAVEWLLASFSHGTIPQDIRTHLAPRLTSQGNVAAYLNKSHRFAAFRATTPVIEAFEQRGSFEARVLLRAGSQQWELDVALETAPPHLIRRFVPRLIPSDGYQWNAIASQVRSRDYLESSLPKEVAIRIHQRLIDVANASHLVALAVAIATKGAIVHQEYLGVADLDSLNPIDADAVFRVGSVTKMITALGVLRLADMGKLDLDNPAQHYLRTLELLPASPGDVPPSVAQLVLHCAGVPRDLMHVHHAVLVQGARLNRVSPQIALTGPPGGRPEYSNLGYEILGTLIEDVADEPSGVFLSREILNRYHLTASRLQDAGACLPTSVVGYRVGGEHLAPVAEHVSVYPASGGMTSTLADLVTFALTISEGTDPLVRTALMQTMPAGSKIRFAPGFALIDRPQGTVAWRTGAVEGFTAELHAVIGRSTAVVLLASKSPPEKFGDLGTELLAHL